MKKKIAFTLAEVLITIGIIGLVAALTLPALIQKQEKLSISSSLKKFYSAMSQAIMLSESNNGPVKYWYRPNYVYDPDVGYDYGKYNAEAKIVLDKYLLPYLKYLKTDEGRLPGTTPEGGTISGAFPTVYFADGSTMQIKLGSCFDMYFDANGAKKPNLYGRDRFIFYFCYVTGESMYGKNKFFGPVYPGNLSTRDDALKKCKDSPSYCAYLLYKFDNWEFKKDYPW